MKKLNHISLLVFLFLLTGPAAVWSQNPLDYEKALTFAKEARYDSARVCIDRYVAGSLAEKDADAWYLYGFIYQRMYRAYELEDHNSKFRLESKKGFEKSLAIDSSKDNVTRNREGFCSLSLSFYNSVVKSLTPKTYETAVLNFGYYKEVVPRCDSTTDVKKSEIDFLLALGTMFEDNFGAINDTVKCKTIDTTAFIQAKESYMSILKIDPLNVKANYNLGVLYHNFAVKLLMNLPPDGNLTELICLQNRADELFKKAAPISVHMYGILKDDDPKKYDFAVLLLQLATNMNEGEKVDFYTKEIERLDKLRGK